MSDACGVRCQAFALWIAFPLELRMTGQGSGLISCPCLDKDCLADFAGRHRPLRLRDDGGSIPCLGLAIAPAKVAIAARSRWCGGRGVSNEPVASHDRGHRSAARGHTRPFTAPRFPRGLFMPRTVWPFSHDASQRPRGPRLPRELLFEGCPRFNGPDHAKACDSWIAAPRVPAAVGRWRSDATSAVADAAFDSIQPTRDARDPRLQPQQQAQACCGCNSRAGERRRRSPSTFQPALRPTYVED